ncbi:unnamed protein product [Victoria cruziana]
MLKPTFVPSCAFPIHPSADQAMGGRLVYQTSKKRAKGSVCPVTGKRIQGIRISCKNSPFVCFRTTI